MTLGLFISDALAQTAQGAGAATAAAPTVEGAVMQFLPLFLIFGVFYFMLIRPQQKKFEQHKAMVEALRRGDKVVIAGGIMGTIFRIDGDEATVEIADDVKVRVQKSSITQVNAKIEPSAETADKKDGK
jgi:preprotein translocase subunit YajC